MKVDKKIGIVVDEDFALKNTPPYPKPSFLSYESPLRIRSILEHFEKINLFKDDRIIRIKPKDINESIIELAHTKYYIDSIRRLSNYGSGLMDDEIFITKDTFYIAKKAISGAIVAIENVIRKEINQSFALIRPPGHHAFQQKGSGLCIFNNIANSILYLRKVLNYKKRIAIVDIDDHFGDGIVQYFYDDPTVLYFSIHEFDFVEYDIGFITELGEAEGLGKNINFPIPMGLRDEEFLEFMEILEPILKEFKPDLIIVAIGFDMHFSDPIGNCNLTSTSYFRFAKRILKIAEEVSEGKLAFVLEGGYSLMGLPLCILAVLKALLNEEYKPSIFENITFNNDSKKEEINKIKASLKDLLKNHWALNK
ncbi:MAG: histone deacetylase [Promethearchaeota archaeon]